ncbi:Ig-like domain-containing protein [uncultured Treponema sp.]|uniref:Ig-like domain-containing protein n=1 Tax=uncultured Treponema sp. TaxID=162155 RepID=UPI00259627CC|nr:Ig-like domain-containing protein [uncultured Treponema sp.]
MKKIWKALAVLTAIALFGSAFTACKSDDDGDDDVSVTGVSLDKTSAELEVGGNFTLTKTIEPANATNQNVSWSSSDKNVATVDENGTVTAVAVGTTDITVKTADGGKEAKCTVTVKKTAEGNVSVTGVSLDKTSAELDVGGTLTLTAIVAPTNATNQNVSWSSSDVKVATVENGTVTAVAVGTADITVKTADGGKEATCTITVKEKTSGSEGGSDDTGDMKVEIKF